MRLFLDANVLFSAARNPEGRAAAILALADRGFCELLTSPHAAEEARRNLLLKHPDRVTRLDQLLRKVVVGAEASPHTVSWALAQLLPPKDAPILAAAVDVKADLLVTGDSTHFGHLYGKTVRGTRVVSLAAALALLLGPRA